MLDLGAPCDIPGAVTEFRYRPPDLPLSVIYRDEQLLVVDKPCGLLSVPGRGEDREDCLILRLRAQFPTVLLVHRLDLDTSGVMVFALTRAAQGNLGQQFEQRLVRKSYVARVSGQLMPDTGCVDLPLVVDWPNRPRQHVNHETGRRAVTEWRVLRRETGETRVALHPLTGRTHQLRVHMAETGHPILGDPLYAQGAAAEHPRLMLHADMLGVRHPASGEDLTFAMPAPF